MTPLSLCVCTECVHVHSNTIINTLILCSLHPYPLEVSLLHRRDLSPLQVDRLYAALTAVIVYTIPPYNKINGLPRKNMTAVAMKKK